MYRIIYIVTVTCFSERMSVLTAAMPVYDVPRPSHEAALLIECWYHGLLTRIRSESLVRAEGDFLVSFLKVYDFTV